MARPRDPTALKIVKGKSHMTKDEKADGLAREVYAANGGVSPPAWLSGIALKHFQKNAEYMETLNAMAGRNVYGSIDVESLVLMSVSYQKSCEYLAEGQAAKTLDDKKGAEAAQKKRLAEDRSYREFSKMLKLDPGNRVDVGSHGDGDGNGDETAALL